MSYTLVTSAKQLKEFCDELAAAEVIAFDTEFVSEHTYRSQLCLVQVATSKHLAVIDPLAVSDLSAFWELLAKPGHHTVVHAGREELGFSLSAVNCFPAGLVDVQIAAGLVSSEYPAGYGSLLSRVLNVSAHKGETRTDWRRRPLSRQQLDYAVDDVRYLIPLHERLQQRLAKLKRLAWLDDEMNAFQEEVAASRTRERWRRLSGLSGLSTRSLAIAREVWRWREAEAERKDIPPRRVLRDDLLVELARRRVADPRQIRAVRGMERGDLAAFLPEIALRIKDALEMPAEGLPKSDRRDVPNQINVLGQFLSTALASLCRSLDLAGALVGTASDVRDLVAYRLGFINGEPPLLARGWRAQVIGTLIEDLLAGNLSIRIADPLSDHPLAFEATATGPPPQHDRS